VEVLIQLEAMRVGPWCTCSSGVGFHSRPRMVSIVSVVDYSRGNGLQCSCCLTLEVGEHMRPQGWANRRWYVKIDRTYWVKTESGIE
jgi:hypothetical protein